MGERYGVFEFISPPHDEAAADLVATVDLIDFPWYRLKPAIDLDADKAVVVKWDPNMAQGSSGKFYSGTYEIHLGTRYASWEHNAPFVFAHEVGHLVDHATLGDAERKDIMALWHADPDTHRYDDQTLNGEEHPWSHEQTHHYMTWRNTTNDYLFHYNEAFADAFVAAFAPSLWGGNPRFVHTTEDDAAIRRLTLRRYIQMFTDVPEDHPHREDIEDLARFGIIEGKTDGSFAPSQGVTRAHSAAFFARLLDKVHPGWRPSDD